MPKKDDIIESLKTIYDPEIYLDIWTLELIYDISISDGNVDITMTFTSIACPAGPYLVAEIKDKISKIADVTNVNVTVVFDPPWEPSEELKMLLGL